MKHAECIIFLDIHGRSSWKKVLVDDCGWETDNFILLGDYFDPYIIIVTKKWQEFYFFAQETTAVAKWNKQYSSM